MKREAHSGKVLYKKKLTDNVIDLKIEKPANFDYKAGQFIQLHIPDPEGKREYLLRAYSLCSIPSDESIALCIKIVPDGLGSLFINQTKIGDSLSFYGPAGQFTVNESNSPLHFVATGVGMAPIIALIREELEVRNNKQNIDLLFGLYHEKDIFWFELLEGLTEKYKNFKYNITLSEPSEHWKGLREIVTKHLPEEVDKDSHYYLCGNPNMVNDVKNYLIEHDLPKTNIHHEIF